MPKNKTIAFVVSERMKQKLIDLSIKQNRTYGFICRRALEKYLNLKEKVR